MNRRNELLDEILQITSQYKDEVSGRGKAWPKAIKDRVRELHDMGMSIKAISDHTGLSYFTALRWRSTAKKRTDGSRGEFKQVPVVATPRQLPAPVADEKVVAVAIPKKTATVTVTKKIATVEIAGKVATVATEKQTVTVTTPKGFRIEGISLSELRMVMESVR